MPETSVAGETALLLVDLLNNVLDKKGKLAERIGPRLRKTNLVANLRRPAAGARVAGVKIIDVPHSLNEHCFDDVKHVQPSWQWALATKLFWQDESGAKFDGAVAPQEGDVIVSRHRTFDRFFHTNMRPTLTEHGIEKVVLAGLTSHTCVESAGRHAQEEGFHVTCPPAAVAEFTEEAHRAALELSCPSLGHEVTTIEEFLAAIETAAA